MDNLPKTREEGVEPDGLNAIKIAIVGLISVFITVATVLFTIALFGYFEHRQTVEKVEQAPYAEQLRMIAEQESRISQFAPPAADGGFYTIPIERAKELVLKEVQSAQAKAEKTN